MDRNPQCPIFKVVGFEPESQYLSAQGSNSDKQQLTQPLHPGLAASPRNAAAAQAGHGVKNQT